MARLSRLERSSETLTAIVITHEHSDHCRGLAGCARRFKLPVWMTPGTFSALRGQIDGVSDIHFFNPHAPFAIGDIEVSPFSVPSLARRP